MQTLKEIRQKKKEEIRKIFPARSESAFLTEDEEDECLTEWLTHKRQNLPFKASLQNTGKLELIDELLEELKCRKENQ